jgi:hypothetical protein
MSEKRSSNEEGIDPSRCPLCGGPNDCANVACDGVAENCWCTAESFPRSLLESVPLDAVGLACICRQCLRAGRV